MAGLSPRKNDTDKMPHPKFAQCDVCGQRHGWLHQRRDSHHRGPYIGVVERGTGIKGSQGTQGRMKWFNYSEFDSPDEPGSGNLMDIDFLEMLDHARNVAGIPFTITSGYRSEDWNAHVGGKKDSSHLKGVAADISCTTSRDRFIIITSLLEAGFDRIGIGPDFIHVDCDWEKHAALVWNY